MSSSRSTLSSEILLSIIIFSCQRRALGTWLWEQLIKSLRAESPFCYSERRERKNEEKSEIGLPLSVCCFQT